MTRIEIDGRTGTVERVSGFSFCRRRERFELARYESVRLSERATAVEEGYGTMLYSVSLEASGHVLELLSTDDENEARSLHSQLAALLSQRTGRKRGA